MVEKKKKFFDNPLMDAIENQKQSVMPDTKPSVEPPKDDPGSNPTLRGAMTEANGKTFLGISPDDVAKIQEGEKRRNAPALAMQQQQQAPVGVTPAELAKVGVLPSETPTQQSGVKDNLATAGLNAMTIAGGASAGAGLGAIAGVPLAPFTAGLSVPVLTGAGALVGGVSAFLGKLSIEKRQDAKEANVNFQNAKTSMGNLITLAKTNPELRDQIITQWNYNLLTIRSAGDALREQNKNIVGSKLADSMDELSDIVQFEKDYPLLYDLPFKKALMGIQ